MNTSPRELHRPTPEEIQAACDVLIRAEPMNSEALQVANQRYAEACRDCAKGLLKTARIHAAMNNPVEVQRLIEDARWHWRHYLMRKPA